MYQLSYLMLCFSGVLCWDKGTHFAIFPSQRLFLFCLSESSKGDTYISAESNNKTIPLWGDLLFKEGYYVLLYLRQEMDWSRDKPFWFWDQNKTRAKKGASVIQGLLMVLKYHVLIVPNEVYFRKILI